MSENVPAWLEQASNKAHALHSLMPGIEESALDKEARLLVQEFYRSFVTALQNHPHPESWTCMIRVLSTLWRGKYNIDLATRTSLYHVAFFMGTEMPIPLANSRAFLTEATDIIKKKNRMGDLELDWRIYHDLIKRFGLVKLRRKALYNEHIYTSGVMVQIFHARKYFKESSIQEIFDFYSPLLCPHDQSVYFAQSCILTFLPTHHQKVIDYLPKIMDTWNLITVSPDWDLLHIIFLSRLAKSQIKNMNWSPYLDFLFTKVLILTDVRVATDLSQSQQQPGYNFPSNCKIFLSTKSGTGSQLMKKSARLIVYAITHEKKALGYLRNLMSSVETFYHPSNSGPWTTKLADLLVSLCEWFSTRYKREKESGGKFPPETSLTEADCKEFAEIMVPVAMSALYSKNATMVSSATHSLKCLAAVQPSIIIPKIIEQASGALQTLTETHQANAIMGSLSEVCRTLVNPHIYKDGIQYLGSLLQLTLPGIDPNDPNKMVVTMKFYSSLFALVPLESATTGQVPKEKVDQMVSRIQNSMLLGEAVHPLSEVGELIDSWSRECSDFFMDFSLQYTDKLLMIFSLMDSPKKKKTQNDELYESFYEENIFMFFSQLSPEIHAACLRRVAEFVRSNVNSNCLKQVGYLCSAAVAAYPEQSLRQLLPIFFEALMNRDKELRQLSESEMVWNLSLLKNCIAEGGKCVINYTAQIIPLLKQTLTYGKSQRVCKEAGKILRKALATTSYCYVNDYRSLPVSIRSSSEYKRYPWMFWGAFFKYEDSEMSWHIPNEDEIAFVQELSTEFLLPTFSYLDEVVGNIPRKENCDYSKDAVWKKLAILKNYVKGTVEVLPGWGNTPYPDNARYSSQLRHNVHLMSDRINFPVFGEGTPNNLSVRIGDLVHKLFLHTQTHSPDDTRTLLLEFKIIEPLILRAKGSGLTEIPSNKTPGSMMKLIHDSIHSPKACSRWAIAHKANSMHTVRIFLRADRAYLHPTVIDLFNDIMSTSTNLYAKIRNKSCNIASRILRIYNWVMDDHYDRLVDILSSVDAKEEEAEGAIQFLRLKNVEKHIFYSWKNISTLVTSILQSQKIQKNTIQKSLESFSASVTTAFTYPYLHPSTLPTIPNIIKELLHSSFSIPEPSSALLSSHEKERAAHLALIDYLVSTINSNTLAWKHQVVAYSFLILISRTTYKVPVSILHTFISGFSADMPLIRGICFRGASVFLDSQKTPYPKDSLKSPIEFNPNKDIDISHQLTEQEWHATKFFDKNYFGWNGFQPEVTCYTYNPEKYVTVQEDEALKLLQSEELLKALVARFVAENRQPNQANFSDENAQLFKGLFARYQDKLFDAIRPHLAHLAQLKDEIACQALSAEIIAGYSRGSKHWPYQKVVEANAFVVDLLRKTIQNCNVECSAIWSGAIQFIVFDRDPRRLVWIHELLLDFSLDSGSSFWQNKKLSHIARLVGEYSWRSLQFFERIMDKILTTKVEASKQIRGRVGRVLATIIRNQYHQSSTGTSSLEIISPRLHKFLLEGMEMCQESVAFTKDHPDYQEFFNRRETFFSLMAELLSLGLTKLTMVYYPAFVKTILYMCSEENQEFKAQIKTLANKYAKILVHTTHMMDAVLSVFDQVSKHPSWHVRLALHSVVQIFIFRHTFVLRETHVERVHALLSDQLLDQQVEVREISAITLSGLLKISSQDVMAKLLKKFTSLSQTPLKKAASTSSVAETNTSSKYEGLLERHGGLLGLIALLRAYPYTVPEWLPNVLVRIAKHSTDPAPIGTSVKKAFGEFWKTHQDMWHVHKECFSEDQLTLLTQQLVAPSYYS